MAMIVKDLFNMVGWREVRREMVRLELRAYKHYGFDPDYCRDAFELFKLDLPGYRRVGLMIRTASVRRYPMPDFPPRPLDWSAVDVDVVNRVQPPKGPSDLWLLLDDELHPFGVDRHGFRWCLAPWNPLEIAAYWLPDILLTSYHPAVIAAAILLECTPQAEPLPVLVG